MARTINEIKQEMTDFFVKDSTIAQLYELDPERTFEQQFSKTSIESILFYVVAAAMWTLEKLFDRHRQEVEDLIKELKPHTRTWYRNKALAFQCGKELVVDTDTYDNEGVDEGTIEAQRVVKYAAVVEAGGEVCIKVATGEEGNRGMLTDEQQEALATYFAEIKDAGVKLSIVNEPADRFGINIDVYYNPQVFDNNLNRLDGTGQPVHKTIANFVENLNFNGEYRNSALINTLSEIEGVVLVELKSATANGEVVNAKYTPKSGYFKVDKEAMKINVIAYETISDRL